MHPHAHHPIIAAILLALFFASVLSTFLAAMDMTALNKEIGRALADAVRELGWEHKQAYLAMGYSKGTWSKILAGEKGLNIARLHRTSFRFYMTVWERLIAIKARDFALEQREDATIERSATRAA